MIVQHGIFIGQNVQVRRLTDTSDDVFFLFMLRQSPRVNGTSFRQESFSYPDHCAWVKARLAEPNTGLYLVTIPEQHDLRIGFGRISPFIEESSTIGSLSYAVSEVAEGQGIGSFLVQQLCLLAQVFKYEGACAQVKPTNLASIRVLERNGFSLRPSYCPKDDDVQFYQNMFDGRTLWL